MHHIPTDRDPTLKKEVETFENYKARHHPKATQDCIMMLRINCCRVLEKFIMRMNKQHNCSTGVGLNTLKIWLTAKRLMMNISPTSEFVRTGFQMFQHIWIVCCAILKATVAGFEATSIAESQKAKLSKYNKRMQHALQYIKGVFVDFGISLKLLIVHQHLSLLHFLNHGRKHAFLL